MTPDERAAALHAVADRPKHLKPQTCEECKYFRFDDDGCELFNRIMLPSQKAMAGQFCGAGRRHDDSLLAMEERLWDALSPLLEGGAIQIPTTLKVWKEGGIWYLDEEVS